MNTTSTSVGLHLQQSFDPMLCRKSYCPWFSLTITVSMCGRGVQGKVGTSLPSSTGGVGRPDEMREGFWTNQFSFQLCGSILNFFTKKKACKKHCCKHGRRKIKAENLQSWTVLGHTPHSMGLCRGTGLRKVSKTLHRAQLPRAEREKTKAYWPLRCFWQSQNFFFARRLLRRWSWTTNLCRGHVKT